MEHGLGAVVVLLSLPYTISPSSATEYSPDYGISSHEQSPPPSVESRFGTHTIRQRYQIYQARNRRVGESHCGYTTPDPQNSTNDGHETGGEIDTENAG